MWIHTTTSYNETHSSKFSFGIIGNSSYPTPTCIAGNSQNIPEQDGKGEDDCNVHIQRQDHSSQILDHSGMKS